MPYTIYVYKINIKNVVKIIMLPEKDNYIYKYHRSFFKNKFELADGLFLLMDQNSLKR